MKIRRSDTGRGIAYTLNHEDGRTLVVHAPSLEPGTTLAKAVANLVARLDDFAGNVGVVDDQFKATARAEQLRAASRNVLSKAFQAAQSDGRKEHQQIAAAHATALSIDPATPATGHIRQRALARWDAAKGIGDKGALIDGLSTEGLAALIETEAYHEVPAEMQTMITEKYVIKRHIERTGLQSDWPLHPDHIDPLKTGPNIEAATAASRAALDRLNARSDAVTHVNAMMCNVIDLVAICTDLKRDEAYNLLVSGAAAT
ncbi:hypothetical protein [uncultured Bradyrhizobium sp.]|uniref:hypothetical protein n=1 Tax=uncultured Bradyrhizobium sp. TaxID=199684 RepID=UPI0026055C9E|nr:hypothetical protein [uncultured Bradyrhizobium sp.]